jgi:hypothetical protein
LSISFIFSKNKFFVSVILCIILLVSISLISAPIFIISFCLLLLGLPCSYFSKSLRCIIRLFTCNVSEFLLWGYTEFELKASHRHSTTWAMSPFCLGYSGDSVSLFAQASLNHDPPILCLLPPLGWQFFSIEMVSHTLAHARLEPQSSWSYRLE